MDTLERLRRQIDTATDLKSVVSTMKTLAAVNIHQYERAVEALNDYNRSVELGFQIVLHSEPVRFESEERTGATAALVFGSDQGMCGQFNEEIASFVDTAWRESGADRRWVVVAVGARVEGPLTDAGWIVTHTYEVPTALSAITNLVLDMLPHFDALRSVENISQLLVFHNHRTSPSTFRPRMLQLLPIDPQWLRNWRDKPWESRSAPMYVTDRRKMLSLLVRQYLFASLFRACAESLASENASRIAAMQAAEINIEERLEELHLVFNQQRQTVITEELLEVVSGFEALTSRKK